MMARHIDINLPWKIQVSMQFHFKYVGIKLFVISEYVHNINGLEFKGSSDGLFSIEVQLLNWYPFIVENDCTRLIPHNRISTVNRRAVSQWKNCSEKVGPVHAPFFLTSFPWGNSFAIHGWDSVVRDEPSAIIFNNKWILF